MTSLRSALAAARDSIPPAEARLLLCHLLQCPLAWLLAHDDETLAHAMLDRFETMVRRRADGEPIAYLLGYREFFGRRFAVSPEVLIPRPETELLVEQARTRLGAKVGAGGTANTLDLGTGSGCIAICIALEVPGCVVTALDRSDAALTIARSNATALGAKVNFIASDWFSALPDTARFDLVVSNPPYIAEGDPHLTEGDLRYEPALALACGSDGLSAIRRIVAGTSEHLTDEGELWLEHGYDQAPAVRALLRAAGFADVVSVRDLAGIERISGGRISDCP